MSDESLKRLAAEAGVAVRWKDVFGTTHDVSPETLRSVLAALGFACASDSQIDDALGRLAEERLILPPLVTATCGEKVFFPASAGKYELRLEDGRVFAGDAEAVAGGCTIPAILEPGWHAVSINGSAAQLAVAPRACPPLSGLVSGGRAYGLAAQLYGLRDSQDGGFGDFAALAILASEAAAHGAQCIAISPVHAQFSADPDRFAPYAPSSRVALNVLHANAPGQAEPTLDGLINWPHAARFKLQSLRAAFDRARNNPVAWAAFAAFRRERGPALELHARFEALHEKFFGTQGVWHWQDWDAAYHDPLSDAVRDFAATHAASVDFHAWAQYQAFAGLADAQAAARSAGMGIGLIADLAVGVDSGGSQSWASPDEMLHGLSIGAPPDLLQKRGQNWGLTALSPRGLRATGYQSFIDMLRFTLQSAGGIRIDHAMGLHRLWVIPEGADGRDGAYIHYPETDLLGLIALHAGRANALIIAEDLGTLPEGFQWRLAQMGILGMRILQFEKDQSGQFHPPANWTAQAAAMTSTHDLPTLAGWWSGRDLAWRDRFGLARDAAAEADERDAERSQLWGAMCSSGAAHGDIPTPDNTAPAVDAAIAHTAGSACELMILPLEDALGLVEQPNIPGTNAEHPNWRRLLPAKAATMLREPSVAARLNAASRRGGVA